MKMLQDTGLPGEGLSGGSTASRMSVTTESMPFTVRIVRSEADLRKAVSIRRAAYARHVPELAELMQEPEPFDFDRGTVVLLAESKLDGEPLGTMRIETNRYKPLAVEQSIQLPDSLQGRSLAEATRLGIQNGRIGLVVKTVLFKAHYLYCLEAGIDAMVVCARSPLDRQYESLLFEDVFPGRGYIPMRHGRNIPHRVLSFDCASARARWAEAQHPLYDFFVRTRHPDIVLSQVESWTDHSRGARTSQGDTVRA